MSRAKELGLEKNSDLLTIRHLLDVEIWECTREQANALARRHRSDSWRIWTVEEVDRWMLADADTVERLIQMKRERPGLKMELE